MQVVLSFFKNITGYNVEVYKEFTKGFTGTRVYFSTIGFEVSEQSIAESIGLAMDGDKWF